MNDASPTSAAQPHLIRRLLAEFIGTGLLVAVVVGSGIAAQRLSPDDVGLQLLQNSLTTALGLSVLILMLGPVSGAHFNPVVSIADWFLGRRARTGLSPRVALTYLAAQVIGGVVGAYIGAAYWFTSSTSFANPAVTIARMFTNTFAGIAPIAVLPFLMAQILGAALGVALLLALYPTATRIAGDAVIPTQPDSRY